MDHNVLNDPITVLLQSVHNHSGENGAGQVLLSTLSVVDADDVLVVAPRRYARGPIDFRTTGRFE